MLMHLKVKRGSDNEMVQIKNGRMIYDQFGLSGHFSFLLLSLVFTFGRRKRFNCLIYLKEVHVCPRVAQHQL